MPVILQHIDQIARQKQRDVLFLDFEPDWPFSQFNVEDIDEDLEPSVLDISHPNYEAPTHPRSIITKWLDDNNIKWQMCGDIASECGWRSYCGQIYIDVPYDLDDPVYQKLSNYLEGNFPDNSGRLRPEFNDNTAKFCVLSLKRAMKNAHHDEPGFWEKWAETF